jgi:L-alanine-DL-glutamate epimerase-like enolase superfamily enzyme
MTTATDRGGAPLRAAADAPVHEIDATAYTVPTDGPEADGTLAWTSTTLVLVRAHAAGRTGMGWTYGPAACAALVVDELAPTVLGRSALDVPAANAAMIRAVRNAGRPGAVGYALSAVDVALWDLKARLLDLPLHRLLGAAQQSVPVYGSGGFTTYEPGRLRDQLAGWVTDQRIPRVKIKIGEKWGTEVRRDLDRLAQTRDVIGPGTELYADANGAYTTAQATRVGRAAREVDLRWFEEPVTSDDLAGLADVRRRLDCDIAAGEYGTDLTYFTRMVAAGAVDCLQADATRCGGITEWLRVAAIAAGHHLEVSAHCAPHLHVHAAAATPNLRHLEWFHDHVRIENLLFAGTLDPTGGEITPSSERPGHGLTLRPDADRYRHGDTVRTSIHPSRNGGTT